MMQLGYSVRNLPIFSIDGKIIKHFQNLLKNYAMPKMI